MNRDAIIKLAREVADPNTADVVFDDLITLNFGEMERFAALVAAQEREACAQLCDIRETMFKGYKAEGLPALCAAAIRARKDIQ